MRLDRPKGFPQLAREIGWTGKGDGRTLLRLAIKREREIGKAFLVRDRAGRPRKATLGSITRYLPELRPSRVDAIADALRPWLVELDARQGELVAAALEPHARRLGELDRRVTELEHAAAPAGAGRPKRA